MFLYIASDIPSVATRPSFGSIAAIMIGSLGGAKVTLNYAAQFTVSLWSHLAMV